MRWVQVIPGRMWSTWLSCHGGFLVIDGSGVTFTGTLSDGRMVARTYDGREFVRL